MSRLTVYITIPKPCHERWDAMSATEKGAFCQSCQKEVIDFSAMTDREVIEYLEKHKTGCGRFRKDQLETNLIIPKIDNGVFRWKALLLGLISFAGLKSAAALPHHEVATTDQSSAPKAEKKDSAVVPALVLPADSDMTICGQVVDEKGEGMISATIVFIDPYGKSTGKGAITDFDGNFSILINKNELSTLQYRTIKISYTGYKSQTVQLSMACYQHYNFALALDTEYVTMGLVITTHYTRAQKIKNWFRHTFRIKHHQ